MAFRFQVITLFPDMIQSAMAVGVFGQAQKASLLQLTCLSPREFTSDVHKTVDDRPFGGGDGMIMMAGPLLQAIAKSRELQPRAKVIYLSPQGPVLTAAKAKSLAQDSALILICGRYGGIDQRVFTEIDEEISLGDYVLSGGEFAACALMDAVSRFVPGVLGHQDSADKDSFSEGLLEHPNFTRPREFAGQSAPEILLSGNHQKINDWKLAVSLLVTLAKRPDLLGADSRRLKDAYKLWQGMSPEDRACLGLQKLTEEDFDGRL